MEMTDTVEAVSEKQTKKSFTKLVFGPVKRFFFPPRKPTIDANAVAQGINRLASSADEYIRKGPPQPQEKPEDEQTFTKSPT